MPGRNLFGTSQSGRSGVEGFADKNLFFNSFMLPLLLAMDEEERRRRRLLELQAFDPNSAVQGDEVSLLLNLVRPDRFSFLTGTPLQQERTTTSTLPGGTFTGFRRR